MLLQLRFNILLPFAFIIKVVTSQLQTNLTTYNGILYHPTNRSNVLPDIEPDLAESAGLYAADQPLLIHLINTTGNVLFLQ